MDQLTFITTLAFFVTVIALVAIAHGRWEIASQAVKGLSGALNWALKAIPRKK